MAVTKIIDIKCNLKQALEYIMNPDKTDGKFLVTGGNCAPEVAYLEFKMTEKMSKEFNGDYSKSGSNLAHHMIQSFDKKDDITPEEAHRIGIELADRFIGDKHEYVVTTHIDKGHIHNHIIFNAYSYSNYKKFRRTKYTFKDIRKINDELCKKNELNIVENTSGKGKSYKEHMETKKGTSWKAYIKDTIDELINKVSSFEELKNKMIAEGFEIKEGKHIAFKAPAQERFCRGKTIGEDYTKESIESRIKNKEINEEITINEKLIIREVDNKYLTRVPYTKKYILLNKEDCKWISEKTLKINLIHEYYNFVSKSGDTIEKLSRQDLYKYYDSKKKDIEGKANKNIMLDENIFVKRKNKIIDIKELADAIVLLRKENISGKEELDMKINELINKKENVRETIKSLESKNVSFNQAAKYIISYNKNKEIFDKYGDKKTKFGTYKKCESEILSFLHAKEKIEQLGINHNVSSDRLIEKIKEQKDEVGILSKELKLVESRINNIANANNKIDDILKDEKEIKRAIER